MEDTFLQVLKCSCREALWRIGLVTGTYQCSNQQWPSEKVSYCGSIAARSPSHNNRLKDPLDLCWYHKGCFFTSERRQRWRGEGAEGKKRRNSVRVKETMHAWGWGLHWGAVSSEDGAVQRTWWVPGEPETVGVRVQMWPKLFVKLLSPGCKCSGLS